MVTQPIVIDVESKGWKEEVLGLVQWLYEVRLFLSFGSAFQGMLDFHPFICYLMDIK